LIDIIRKVHEIEGIERIRLGSIEPTTVTEEFVRAIKGMEKLCPQFHISLQSGCDSTLKRMNRKYTTKEYLRSVELLRENLKDVAVTTDVMVGFPGETDEEFNETCRFVEKVLFARMHVFKYSRRKGTPAASYPDQVAPQKKEERSRILIELASRMTLEYNKSFTGRVLPVLFEQEVKGKEGFMEGLTPNYIRVECKGDKDIEGQILNVLLREAKDDYIVGEIVN